MIGRSFNDGWTYGPRPNLFDPGALQAGHVAVTLPHDAMLLAGRDPDGDPALAFHRTGSYQYGKVFTPPSDWVGRSVSVRFEGVYRDAVVFFNGEHIAQRPYGYSEVVVDLDPLLRHGEENTLRVECRTGVDARWYTGAGIYRDVTLFVGPLVHVAVDGIHVTTPAIDDEVATVEVDVEVINTSRRQSTAELSIEIVGPDDAVVARDTQPVTVPSSGSCPARARVLVHAPQHWSPDHPALYRCRVTLADGDETDEAEVTFGIRTITVDADRGLRINGAPTELRGACIHHDNGVLGAATFGRADERRVELLKAAGFNALRSAHHPMGRALLDACDRLGVLVMDEAFDVWVKAKRDLDHSLRFSDWWERDIDSMVRKDRNHPSVVLYSIGNEIPETGDPAGAQLGRRLTERIRALDPTRPITNGVNFIFAVLDHAASSDAGGVLLNDVLGSGSADALTESEEAGRATAESFAVLDIAGYNYAEGRYEADAKAYPNRVIVRSESFPLAIDRIWALVRRNVHVIGDFTWTGWDYLGEVGIGRIEHEGDAFGSGTAFMGTYPWRYAACADIDVTGHRLPMSYYREIVFGLRTDPFIAVRPPAQHGRRPVHSSRWGWSTGVESWTWDGDEGRDTTVEVYAAADEVELWKNGTLVGREPAGETHRFTARFETSYEPGELVAVAFSGDQEVGRSTLATSAGALALGVTIDRETIAADHRDLAFVTIEVVDGAGTIHPGVDCEVAVTVTGAAVLQGLGSAAPASEESFLADRCTTFRGRALAVVRPTEPGELTVTVTADGHRPTTVTGRVR